MTVSTDLGYQRTSGDGVVTVFGVDFALIEAAQLIVELVNKTTGVISPQVLGTNFTLAIAADNQSATVTMLVAPPATHWIIRRRSALYTQPTHLLPHGPFPADLVELAIDRMAMNIQAIRDGFLRGIRFNDTDPPNPATLPPLAEMLGKYLYIDGSGNPIGVAGEASAPVSAQWAPIVVSASLAAGLSLLGFSSYMQSLLGTASKAALRAALGIDIGDTWAIWGLLSAKNGANTIDLTAGGAMATDGVTWLAYAGGTALDIATLFSGGGTLDTGSIGNNDYYVHLVSNGTLVRPLTSLSATAPTMPSGYTTRRLVGWFKREGGAIAAFKTVELAGGGLRFEWTDPREDIRLANTLTATRRTDALSVPRNFSVTALLTPSMYDAGGLAAARICCPDEADAAVYTPNALFTTGVRNANLFSINATLMSFGDLRIRTDATGNIAARASAGITADMYVVQTNGFEWSRRLA